MCSSKLGRETDIALGDPDDVSMQRQRAKGGVFPLSDRPGGQLNRLQDRPNMVPKRIIESDLLIKFLNSYNQDLTSHLKIVESLHEN